MKYWLGFSFLVVFLVGMLTFILIDNSTGVKSSTLPKDNILFSVLEIEDNNTIFCGKNWNDEFQNYTLEISSKNGESFVNPRLTKSANVTIISQSFQNHLIEVKFYVKSGTNISFELSADNFETNSQTFSVSPFENVLDIRFANLFDKLGNSYLPETEINEGNEKYVLYFIEASENFEDAIKDKLPCVLNYASFANEQLAENYTLASSNKNVLAVDLISKTITPKGTGTACIIFEVFNKNWQQKISKTIHFIVKTVPVKEVENLTELIEIEITENDTYDFQYEITPHYSSNFNIELSENSDDDVISLSKNAIVGLQAGEVQINFIINSEIYKIITVKVTDQDTTNNNSDPDQNDPNSEDSEQEDPNSEDPNSEDPEQEDPNSEDPNSEDPNSEDPNSGDLEQEDPDPEDSDPQDPDPEPDTEYFFNVILDTNKNGLNFNNDTNTLNINLNELQGVVGIRLTISLTDKDGNPVDPSFKTPVVSDSNNMLVEPPGTNNSGHEYKLFLCVLADVPGMLVISITHNGLDERLIIQIISN